MRGTGSTDSAGAATMRVPAPPRQAVGDFRKLLAWQRSQALTVLVYRVTRTMPAQERYGLSAQMRRAALSVASNLAEGCGRRRDTELCRFIRISQGSLAELECQALIASDLQFVAPPVVSDLLREIHEVRGMLGHLHRSLRPTRAPRPPPDPRLPTKTLDPRP